MQRVEARRAVSDLVAEMSAATSAPEYLEISTGIDKHSGDRIEGIFTETC